MVFPSTLPMFDASLSTPNGPQRALSAASGGQTAKSVVQASCGRALQVRCSWQRGRLMPTVRCVLVGPEYGGHHHTSRLGSSGAAAPVPQPGPKLWNSSAAWVSRTRRIAVALADTHKAWSSQSFQTLQRVGSIIRSTSLDCLAALGKKEQQGMSRAAAAQASLAGYEQQPGTAALLAGAGGSSSSSGGGGGDPQDEEDRLVKASLSRFLTAAEEAEINQAARMSDLSDMAYNVLEVTPDRLQQTLGLTLITHSRSNCSSSSSAGPVQASLAAGRQEASASPADQPMMQQPLLLQQQQQQLPQAPWPVPLVLLQPTGSGGGGMQARAADYSVLPASPRAPAVMRSFAEEDAVFELQAVPASAPFADPGSPRRPSAAAATAAAAAAGGSVAVAPPMGMPAATAMGDGPPAMMMQQQQQSPSLQRQHSGSSLTDYSPAAGGMLPGWDMQYPAAQFLPEEQQEQDYYQMQQLSMDEAALLQQLKQQEAFILLELQASQQMMMLLQQSSQQQQQLHLHQAAGDTAAAAHDLEQLQELAAATTSITAAASTAAAAALAGSGMLADAAAGLDFPVSSSLYMDVVGGVEGGSIDAAAAAGAEEGGAPADWFCCDGPLSGSDATPTRFFSIQGSLTLEHWRINLTIDPCEFAGGELGPIRVHRGMYEAALSMYDALLPLVQQHLAAHPDGKIVLTGHSLGGSLATLLMLLMVHRGDLPAANVATVYTFGSPAVFCEGANGAPPSSGACQCCSLPCEHRKSHATPANSNSSATDSLLSRLGLDADAVVNVIMTRDIVPRAFVCDYTLVAGVLKSWLPSFKQHQGLAACKEHKALYNFIGVVEVLQPSTGCDFVLPDEGHDMLPPGAALYKLTEPRQPASPPAAARHSSSDGASSSSPSPRRGSSSFNSLSSLTNITSMSLSSALAELTSSFSLGGGRRSSAGGSGKDSSSNNGSNGAGVGMVTVPVTEAEAQAEAAAATKGSTGDVSPFALVISDSDALPSAGAAGGDGDHPMSPAGAVAASSAMRGGGAATTKRGSSSCSNAANKKSPEGLTLGDAILTFMNSPHPLQTLGEMRAYGHNGSISRYHNPTSYTKALQQLSRE